jgi:hypothetical protein
MAGEWRTVPLSELYEFSSGLSKPRAEFGFGRAFLTFKDVLDTRVSSINCVGCSSMHTTGRFGS